jgi:hypothetical protein
MISYLVGDPGIGITTSESIIFRSFLSARETTHELRGTLPPGSTNGFSFLPGGTTHLAGDLLPPLTYSTRNSSVTLERINGLAECKVVEVETPTTQSPLHAFTVRSTPGALLTQANVNSRKHPGQYFMLTVSKGNAWIGAHQVAISSPVTIGVEGEFWVQIEGETAYLQGSASSFRINNEEQLSKVLSSYVSRSLIEGAVLVVASLMMGYLFRSWTESRKTDIS